MNYWLRCAPLVYLYSFFGRPVASHNVSTVGAHTPDTPPWILKKEPIVEHGTCELASELGLRPQRRTVFVNTAAKSRQQFRADDVHLIITYRERPT